MFQKLSKLHITISQDLKVTFLSGLNEAYSLNKAEKNQQNISSEKLWMSTEVNSPIS